MRKTPILLSTQRLEMLTRSLKISDVVEGTIVSRLGKDRYVIAFQGRNFIASYAGFLKKGSTVQTIVQQIEPQIVFKILSGYAMPRDLAEHENNLLRIIRSCKSDLALRPHCANLCSDIEQTIQELMKVGALKDEGVAMMRSLQTFIGDLVFDPTGDIISYIKRYLSQRAVLSYMPLMDTVMRIEKVLMGIGDGDYDQATELLGELSEAVKKLYLILRLEQSINSKSTMQKKGLSYVQVPLRNEQGMKPLDVYFVKENQQRFLIRCIGLDRSEDDHCFCYEHQNKILRCSRRNLGNSYGEFIALCQKSGISVCDEDAREPGAVLINSEPITFVDIIKPVKFDLVI